MSILSCVVLLAATFSRQPRIYYTFIIKMRKSIKTKLEKIQIIHISNKKINKKLNA